MTSYGAIVRNRRVAEKVLKAQLMSAAKAYGWLGYHALPAMTASGRWLTVAEGNPGFPDLVLVHPTSGRMVVAELKSDIGRIRPAQRRWLDAFEKAGAEVYVWRPGEIADAIKVLGPNPPKK